MGIFDFFRKLAKANDVQEIVVEKLAFSEIEAWIEKKIKENEVKEKEIIFVVKKKIENFIKELKEKIVILQGFDVESKKAEDRIKGVVSGSRAQYIEMVGDFMVSLENLKETKFSEFIERVDKIFFDFNKASFNNYERATILIGKEMANIKESLKVFSKDLLKIFDENKPLIDSFKNLLIIKKKLDAIAPIDKILKKISEKKLNLNKKISEKEEENKKLLEDIEKIKESPNYLEGLRTQKKIESLKEELKSDIFGLKQLLDFKALANFFHINEEQMRMVKNHRENFQINFEKDNGKTIIELLDEAKLNKDIISEKVKQIRAKVEETTNYEREIKEDEIQEVHLKIKEVRLEIDNLKIEKIKEEKRDEKLKTSKEELISILKQELGEMNVEMV